MPFPRRRSTRKQRQALWEANQYPNGSGGICIYCPIPIRPGESWQECHEPIPHAHGGTQTALGHIKCHRVYTATVTIPTMRKGERVKERHLNIRGEGLGLNPMQGGRRSHLKKTMSGRVVVRLSLREKLIAAEIIKG